MQQMGTVDFIWSVHCSCEYIHARRSLLIVRMAFRHKALRTRSRAYNPASYNAHCWAFVCSQLRPAVSLVEVNCRSEYYLYFHQRGLIACNTLRKAAEGFAVDLVVSFLTGGGGLSNVFSPGLVQQMGTAAVTFLSVTLAHVMCLFACNARNNCVPKCDIHTNSF